MGKTHSVVDLGASDLVLYQVAVNESITSSRPSGSFDYLRIPRHSCRNGNLEPIWTPTPRYSRRNGNPEPFSPFNLVRACRNVPGEPVSEVQAHNGFRIIGGFGYRIMLPISNVSQVEASLITTFVLLNTSETYSVGTPTCPLRRVIVDITVLVHNQGSGFPLRLE